MTVAYLLIPLFFVALIVYVSWPLLSEPDIPARPEPMKEKRKRRNP